MELIGRTEERRVLADLLAAVRSGHSRVLVVSGHAGVGKTALLDELARRASACQVFRLAGVESEMELAFAALHQLYAAMPEGMDHLPAPQRHALLTVFGERLGPTPDPFLTGLAVLGLVSEAAHHRAVMLLIDDRHWLDRASRRVIAFLARRLRAEAVAWCSRPGRPGRNCGDCPG